MGSLYHDNCFFSDLEQLMDKKLTNILPVMISTIYISAVTMEV